jgi:SAM-dependent methyltransferase
MTPTPGEPSDWLVMNADLLTPGGRALDVACGSGRHALWLAGAGFDVQALDRDAARIAALREHAARLARRVDAHVVDLEAGGVTLGDAVFDLVLVVNYLHRPLMPAILAAVKPGGLLVYETFTVGQEKRGRPTNPAFLLQRGELPRLVRPLTILRVREGEFGGRFIASVVAQKKRLRVTNTANGKPGGTLTEADRSTNSSRHGDDDRRHRQDYDIVNNCRCSPRRVRSSSCALPPWRGLVSSPRRAHANGVCRSRRPPVFSLRAFVAACPSRGRAGEERVASPACPLKSSSHSTATRAG